MRIALTLVFVVAATVSSCNGLEVGPKYDPRADDMPVSRCRGKSFCLYRGRYYPQRDINNILKRYPPIQHRFGSDEKYDSRVGDSPSIPECKTQAPGYQQVYYIKDNQNRTRVVVQSQKYNVEQKYEFRWCTKPGLTNETEHFKKRDLKNVTMTCQNIRTSLDFMVLSLDRRYIEMIAVRMPVFCKARYSKKDVY